MTRPFHNAGLAIDNARTHLQGLDYLRIHDPEGYVEVDGEADRARTILALRGWLVSMRDAIDHELAELPVPPVKEAESCSS